MTLIRCSNCGTELYDMKIPVWLVWEHRRNEDQLRAIDLDVTIAETHKKMIETENENRGVNSRISIEGTELNHLFAWTMIKRLRGSEAK